MLKFTRPSHRVLGGAVVATLVLGSAVGAEAAAKKPVKHTRTVKVAYTGGCGIVVNVAGSGASAAPGNCVLGGTYDVTPNKGEKYVTLTVSDATGRPVGGEIWTVSNGTSSQNQPFCGGVKDFILTGGVTVDLNTPALDSTCPGGATQGTLTIAYSNLP
jgi:hypothetical protein